MNFTQLLKYPQMPDATNESGFFRKMISLSLTFHLTLIIIFSLKAVLFPSETLDIDSSIRVDMVDLPDMLVQMPQKPQEAPTDVKKPEAKPVEQAKPQPIAEKKPEPLVLKPTAKSDAQKKIEKFKEQEHRKKAIEEIEKQVQQEEARAREEKLSQIKSVLIKGNHINQGTALRGLNKAAFNDYASTLKNQVHEHWNLPQWLKGANLHAVVRIYIDHRGVVIKKTLQQSSGDEAFDNYALKAVDDAQPFPPPPDKFTDLVQLDGIGLNMQP
jgi:colicin import membrane protein